MIPTHGFTDLALAFWTGSSNMTPSCPDSESFGARRPFMVRPSGRHYSEVDENGRLSYAIVQCRSVDVDVSLAHHAGPIA